MDNLDFTGRVALVTGVSRTGLGFHYAKMLAEHGCTLVVNDYGVDWAGNKSSAATEAVVNDLRELGAEVLGVTANIVTEAQSIVDEVIAAFGRLDIVVNNAGAGGSFDQQIDVHLLGANRVTEAAWEHLAKSGSGRIINVSSSGSFGAPAMPGYAAAKGGIISLTRTQALLGAELGIQANVILPSAWTPSTAGIDFPGFSEFMKKYMQPEKVASFVTFLAHESNTVTGQSFSVGGGLVTRVVFAETDGAVNETNNAAEWQALMPKILDTKDLSIVTSMWGHLEKMTAKLSDEAAQDFNLLGIDTETNGRLSSRE